MTSKTFEKFAGTSAILAGITGFLYAVAFIVISRNNPQLGKLLSSLFLLLLGFLSVAALVAVYNRLQAINSGFALWALILGIVGAVGANIHGGFDLANAINPPTTMTDLPSQVDPRGLLTFAYSGIAVFVISWLISKGGQFPRALGVLGYIAAILLLVIYLGRLIILDPTNPILLWPVLVNGFGVYPVWYVWLGVALLRQEASSS